MVSFKSVNLRQDEEGKTILDLEVTVKKDSQTIILMFSLPATADLITGILKQALNINEHFDTAIETVGVAASSSGNM